MIEYGFIDGIKYTKPSVYLLQDNGIGVAEIAARTCYDSFELSENDFVKDFPVALESAKFADGEFEDYKKKLNKTEESDLLDRLAWAYHHHSILEHAVVSFYIEGTSRGVLQEHARHRIQAISVRSTRYTMSDLINAFIATKLLGYDASKDKFVELIEKLDMFVTADKEYNRIEIECIYDKLVYQLNTIGIEEFVNISMSKENIASFKEFDGFSPDELYKILQDGKKKRNVGDAFKHIVSDNWKTDLVVTFNIRSLKNYFDLRDSGAAYEQIKWLAEDMKLQTPLKYLKLIDKKYKN